ncbi:hypothetical protein [Arthrobacter sp. KBS0703]|nr:hypothetical protein [Arthrobacter sp. KBS0703]
MPGAFQSTPRSRAARIDGCGAGAGAAVCGGGSSACLLYTSRCV